MTFHYIGRPPQWHPNRMIARLQSWNYYRRDMRDVLPLAARLHEREHFDLSHHVTYASWRIGSPLWRLPVPFIWGPVGGGESFPAELDATLSLKARLMERLRRLSNSGRIPNGAARLAARRSTACIAANSETLHLLRRLRGSPDGTARLLQVFFTPLEIRRFTAPAARERPPAGPLRLFAGGNIEGGKGFHIAFEALALARQRSPGFQFQYTLGGAGPELSALRQAAARLGLSGSVTFHPGFQGGDYLEQLGSTHVYLLPSLRDSAGTTLMEAMLAGCVPVVAKRGGPGDIVTGDGGHCVEVVSAGQLAGDLADILIQLDRNRPHVARLGALARNRILTTYAEQHYLGGIDAIYADALHRWQAQHQGGLS